MRRLSLFLCLAPLIAFAQTDDARLSVPVTLRYRYLALSDLGKLVQAKTLVPVKVDRDIADRKVSLFCDDRPVGEILRKVGDTLYVEWLRDGDGYRLSLRKDAAREERSLLAKDAALAREALRSRLAQRASLARNTIDELKAELDEVEKQLPKLRQDTSDAGKRLYAAKAERYSLLFSIRYNRYTYDEGYVAAQLTSDHYQALIDGNTLFASTTPRPGMLRLSSEALNDEKTVVGGATGAAKEMLITVRYDADRQRLEVRRRPLSHASGSSTGIGTALDLGLDPAVLEGLATAPLIKRLAEWAKTEDPSVLSLPLSRKAEAPKAGPEGVWTLADNLQWLHDRTGAPIVADAFRVFASYDAPTEGKDIGEWLKLFNQTRFSKAYWYPARVRTEGGWLMMQHRRFWRQQPLEIPERLLAPLEAKRAAGQDLTLDDYAGLAAALTPAQESGIRNQTVLAGFPIFPLYGTIPTLRLYRTLTSGQRTAAAGGGLPVSAMSGPQVSLYRNAILGQLWDGLVDESVLSYLLPGAPPLPAEMRLFIGDSELMSATNERWEREGEPGAYSSATWRTAEFTFGVGRDSMMKSWVMLAKKG